MKYAGFQAGDQCFCGNKYGSLGEATNCDQKCSGNADEICGGDMANSVYEVPYCECNLCYLSGLEENNLHFLLFK